MDCPNCKKKMLAGYLHNSAQRIQWIPEDSRPSIFRFGVADNAVLLNNTVSFSGYKSEAFYCPECKIVLLQAE